MPSTPQTLFISDAHLGINLPGYSDREKVLFSFFREIAPSASELYILGDLFDFWIEYQGLIRSDYFPAAYELKRLTEMGIAVHYLTGNHDFAMGSFLSKEAGVHLHHDHFETLIQGKKTHCYHGDGLLKADGAYRILRRILRNPLNQQLFKLLPPTMGIGLASFFSGSSRSLLSLRQNPQRLAEYRQHAKEFLDAGNDVVIFGHTHNAELTHWGEKVYCNTGEWIKKRTFARMDNGKMSLWTYSPGKSPESL